MPGFFIVPANNGAPQIARRRWEFSFWKETDKFFGLFFVGCAYACPRALVVEQFSFDYL